MKSFFLIICFFSFSAQASANNCSKLAYPLNYDLIKEFVKKCKISSGEELIAALPEEIRAKYTLVYDSRALGDATPLHPRVIFFGHEAKFVVSFGGHADLRGYDKIEFMEFDEKEKDFSFSFISFPKDSGSSGPIEFSKRNPQMCLNCHQNRKPLWDTYEGWPGIYGSDDDFMPAKERAWHDQYMAEIHGKYDRYRYFSEKKIPHRGYNQSYYPRRKNLYFSYVLTELNGLKMSKELGDLLKTDPDFFKYRYAILNALVCHTDYKDAAKLEEFLPKDTIQKFRLDFGRMEKDTENYVLQSEANREKRQARILGEISWDFRQVESFEHTQRLRWILENLGIKNLDQWSMEFGHKYMFNPGPHYYTGGLEVHLFKELFTESQHPQLYQLMSRRGYEGEVHGNTENKCAIINELSLDALK